MMVIDEGSQMKDSMKEFNHWGLNEGIQRMGSRKGCKRANNLGSTSELGEAAMKEFTAGESAKGFNSMKGCTEGD